ncbi:MAG TPA: CHAT domain-containing tetratricopeptide repeat protein, partial [Hyphomicrobiaceae bacterium]|nr:CHAT domain-containing tetratricopeptide repeat protein [Hyphomicrobiaceae bacterium]
VTGAPASAGNEEAVALIRQANQLNAAGNCEAAIPLAEKAAGLLRKPDGPQTGEYAAALVAQALCHRRLLRVAEAERLYREAIDIYERGAGPESRELAIILDNLATLYADHGRLADSERLRLRALQIFRASVEAASPHVATALQNLAVLYQQQGRSDEARDKFLEALPIAEQAFGSESRQVGIISDNLAGLYRSQGQFTKAEPLYQRALAIFRTVLGGEHPDTALALQNHAVLLGDMGQYDRAEQSLKEAIAIDERLYGDTHDSTVAALNTLVLQYMEQQRWPAALEAARRAAAIAARLADRGKVQLPSERGQRSSIYRRLVQAAYTADSTNIDHLGEAFLAAQRALDTNAALALKQLAARYASGDDALARLLRERQDLLEEGEENDRKLVAAVGKPSAQRDRAAEDQLKVRIREIGARVGEIDQVLGRQFPDFAALSKAAPASLAATQALLQPDEALVQFIDLQAVGRIPETGFAWLITRQDVQWVRLPLGTRALARAVAALRCGLDNQRWADSDAAECNELLQAERGARQWLPFDLGIASGLYRALFGPFEAKIKGKHLLVVPSGALTGLPFSVLVAETPAEARPTSLDGYRRAAWLGARQPITVLPSVGSLQALRQFAKTSKAARPYLGIGNPLLEGPQSDPLLSARFAPLAELARDKQRCAKSASEHVASAAGAKTVAYAKLFRGRNADIEAVREWAPLPETADELCEVGRRLGVPESEILLGSKATETALKGLSEGGRLAEYAILHFATHGALTGDVQGVAEPGLILTPPPAGTTDPASLQRDDGFLTASEIATLKLNADWVVLSACNTAGGSGETAEALSGMARAFFYAGARTLLVSHWEVGSEAAVKLVTRAFAELKTKPGIGRAEAFRASMRAMIEDGNIAEAHPAYWAPFVVVGEGSAQARSLAVGSTSPPAAATPAASAPITGQPAARRSAPAASRPPAWTNRLWDR